MSGVNIGGWIWPKWAAAGLGTARRGERRCPSCSRRVRRHGETCAECVTAGREARSLFDEAPDE